MLNLLKTNLSLFDETAAQTGEAPEASSVTAESQGNEEATAPEIDKEKEFKDLIKGEYKDAYQKSLQKIFDRRFAEMRSMQDQLTKNKSLTDILKKRYGENDIEKLTALIENDEVYFKNKAEQLNIPMEEAMRIDAIERENARLYEFKRDTELKEFQKEKATAWYREAEAIQGEYPDFDLIAELESPAFAAQLKAGVPMKLAYQTAHFNELLNKAGEAAAKKAEKLIVDNIKARGIRPSENGSSSQNAAFLTKKDISKFTKSDFEEFGKRAARGEYITFN